MNRSIYLFILFIWLYACSENLEERQYFSIQIHNNSDLKLKNVLITRDKFFESKTLFGNVISKSYVVNSFQYTPLEQELIVSWDDLENKKYEQKIDLTGIFPTQFDGGQFHIIFNEDLSVYYTFVINKTVYSPTNRTAK